MKIGIFTALFGDKSFTESLDIVKAEGTEAVEFGTGGYANTTHLAVEKMLESKAERDKVIHEVESRGLTISALSCHGNPIHPVKKIAEQHHDGFVKPLKPAGLGGVPCVT